MSVFICSKCNSQFPKWLGDLLGDISEIRLKLNEIINYINLEIGEKQDEK